ncbi:MAG: single-stranded-DNA-specific exonuclease RecJ [Kiritimatiellia bacterium]|nr:single-stranded-DNA-specific exonuclease RecJ [Lentisphaerota bacterium]
MKIWRTAAADDDVIACLAVAHGLPRAAAAVLAARCVQGDVAVRRFLHPRLSDLGDPFALPDMAAAVTRIWRALDNREAILIFGDYDTDGITSTVLLARVLWRLGAASVTPVLPNRLGEGYGFTEEALRRGLELCRPSLIITVDNGISAGPACAVARAAGIDVVITDHHEPSGPLPDAAAVVNPKLHADGAERLLAGVGVVFKLCHALVAEGRRHGRAVAEMDLRDYLDLVMLGTVADIVPLLGENRILVRHGLACLERSQQAGWRALMSRAGITPPLNARQMAFALAPRLNAAGRMGAPDKALELLLTDDAARAALIARELDAANRQRQATEIRIVGEATGRIDGWFDPERHYGLVIAEDNWHPGVVGIVAARLVGRYHRPVVVVSFDEQGLGRGSARGIEGHNLLQSLQACSDHLESFGGHALAAGVVLRRRALDDFAVTFNAAVTAAMCGRDLRPVQSIDAWTTLGELDEALLTALDRLQPFGQDNPTPVFAAAGVHVEQPPQAMAGRHLRFTVADGSRRMPAVGFGMADRPPPPGRVDLAFQFQQHTWRGRRTLQLNVQDWRPAE